MPTYKGVIKPNWDAVIPISEKIAALFPEAAAAELDSIRMVCVELFENVIKYGKIDEEHQAIFKVIKEDSGRVLIIVTNKLKAREDMELVAEHLSEISQNGDKFKVFTKHLEEFLDERKNDIKRRGMGLYRIAYEGKFKLGYQVVDDKITIIAEREFGKNAQPSEMVKPARMNESREADLTGKPMELPEFKNEDLSIRIHDFGHTVNMAWTGRSQFRSPAEVLIPYFKNMVGYLDGKRLQCDFSTLKYMNSSTIPAIIDIARLLNDNKVQTTFYYDKSLEWQVVSFQAFGRVVKNMVAITISEK